MLLPTRKPGLLLAALFCIPRATTAAAPARLLVLGGTGFVGKAIVKEALRDGWAVTSLSRRGTPAEDDAGDGLPNVEWRRGDATDAAVVESVVKEGNFDAAVHAIGMLFASDLNKLVSGSLSIPSPGATYDKVTRQTALAAAKSFAALQESRRGGKSSAAPPPMVFVSAAEARWNFDGTFKGTPFAWLHDYLIAKRAVEDALLNEYGGGPSPALRPVILRPSLVWTTQRPLAIPAVAAFTAGNALRLPFVDRPVKVDTLAAAAVRALSDPAVRGIQDYNGMEKLAAAAAAAARRSG